MPAPGLDEGRRGQIADGFGESELLLSLKEWEGVQGRQSLQLVDMRVTCIDGRPIPVLGTAVVDALSVWGATMDVQWGRVNLDPPAQMRRGPS